MINYLSEGKKMKKQIDTQYRINSKKYMELRKKLTPVEIDYFMEAIAYEAKKCLKKK